MKQLLLLIVLGPFTLFSNSGDSIASKKLSIGFTFSPDYCYRKITPDAASFWIASHRDSIEIPKFGFTTGFNLAYKFNKRWSIETGFLFSDKGEKTIKQSLSGFVVVNPNDPSLPSHYVFVHHYCYLDIPVKANLYLLTKRTKIYLTAGATCNVFLTKGSQTISEFSDGHSSSSTNYNNIDGYSRFNFAYFAGLGFSYDFTDKFYLKLEPTYRRSINSIIDTPIKGYLYSMGLNTGVYYIF